jgi:protein TonB
MNARAGIAVPREPPASGPIVEPDGPTGAAWDAAIPFPDALTNGVPEPQEDADPVAAPAREAPPPGQNAGFPATRLGAFLSSTVIHVLALTLAAGALVVAGRQPPKEESVSVEIVLEAPAKPVPPAQPEEASDAAAAQIPPPIAPEAEEVETPPEEQNALDDRREPKADAAAAKPVEEEPAVRTPAPDAVQPRPSEDLQAVAVPQPDSATLSILSVPPIVPVPATTLAPASPQDPAEKVESPRHIEPEKTQKVEQEKPAGAREQQPTPKEPTVHKEARKERTRTKKAEKSNARREKVETSRAQQDRKTGREHNGAARPRPAAASPGEKAAYARKLLAHVQRYKRYPPAAERAGITGAARLSITIGRSGSLRGARLVSSAGNALLDKEAMAVAHRASPYPPPPAGMGGSTFSFIVTLRFSR